MIVLVGFSMAQRCAPQKMQEKDIKLTANLKIPEGGTLRFEYKTPNIIRGRTIEFNSRTVGYGEAQHFILSRSGKSGEYKVDINKRIESLSAFIKDKDGKETRIELINRSKGDKASELALPVRPTQPEEKKSKSTEDKKVGDEDKDKLTSSPAKSNEKPTYVLRSVTLEPSPSTELTSRGLGGGLPTPQAHKDMLPTIPEVSVESLKLSPAHSSTPKMGVPVAPIKSVGSTLGTSESRKAPLPEIELAEIQLPSTARPIGPTAVQSSTSKAALVDSAVETAEMEALIFGDETPLPEKPKKVAPEFDLAKLEAGTQLKFTLPNGRQGSFTVPSPNEYITNYVVGGAYLVRNEDQKTFRFEARGTAVTISQGDVKKSFGSEAVASVPHNAVTNVNSRSTSTLKEPRTERKAERREEHGKLDLSGTTIQLGKLNELNGRQLQEFLTKYPEQRALVVGHASYCQPCGQYAGQLTQFAKQNPDIAIIRVDIEANRNNFTQKYSIDRIPSTQYKGEGATTLSSVKTEDYGYKSLETLTKDYKYRQ
jgi:hypothetical protein